MTEILDGALWLCGIGELRLEVANVQPYAIINVAQPDDFREWESPCDEFVEVYHEWPFLDGDLPNLEGLHETAQIGVDLLNDGRKVIVHCAAGHNRSGLVAALIVRKMQNISGREAADFIQQRRRYTLWNKRFLNYLYELDEDLPLMND